MWSVYLALIDVEIRFTKVGEILVSSANAGL